MKSQKEIIDWLCNGIQPGLSMRDLTNLGIISEEITETDEVKIVTRTFTAHDDSMTKIITLYIPKESKEDVVKEINKQIQTAVQQEDYLKASELQKQKQIYLQS